MSENIWHAMEASAVLESNGSRMDGLTDEESRRRLEQYGANRLPAAKTRGPIVRFLKQFDNLLIYVLLASSLVTALLQHWVDSSVIFGVVFINAIIGFVQEGKAEKALEAIRNMLTYEASVVRNGRRVTLAAEDLVPGDIVLVEPGDKIPADFRLQTCKELRVDESVLTGESVPVEKTTAPIAADADLAERSNMAYAGTFVTSGRGSGVIVATGRKTEMGRISEMVRQVGELQTPLLRKMSQFARHLTVVILAVAGIVFAFGVFVKGRLMGDMFLAGVGLAVAAIPEGLPAVITIALAIGVSRMARRNAIIRRLPAVEALGSVTVICSDKTGTLTRNEMTVTTVVTSEHVFSVTGTGYEPHGEIRLEGNAYSVEKSPVLVEMARAAVLCNDASVHREESRWKVSGDPTEAALIVFGQKCGLEPYKLQERWSRADVIPFESERRFMATLNDNGKSQRFIYVKGAPETLLEMCSRQRSGNGDVRLDKVYWHECVEKIAANGQRALAVAYKPAASGKQELLIEDVKSELVFLGLCGIIDPPREEAILAVKKCQEAGIKVKMISGDNSLTAQAIGKQMGIGVQGCAMTGHQLQEATEEQLQKYAREVDVFGRVSAEHKLILVRALQAQGHIVAMTGDGVNDAPALKQADIGVAMGCKGTEAAKEVAEMVLADDNFASIANAVEEGRTVYDNIQKSIIFILPTNIAEALVIIAAIFLGYELPITPLQILWVNMISAVTLALALSFEAAESNVMKRPPREPKEAIISGLLIWRLVFVSAIFVVGTFALFMWERSKNGNIETARTIAVNAFVMFEVFYLFNTRYLYKSVMSWKGFLGNRYVLVAIGVVIALQMVFTYVGYMQHVFGTVGLSWVAWLRITAAALGAFVLVEIEKAWLRFRSKKAKIA